MASFASLLEKQSTSERIRAAEPLGFDFELFQSLRHMGVVEMAVSEAQGGWGADLLDLALIAELIGRHCAPAPVIEAQVAARLLARIGAAAEPLLSKVLAGKTVVTLALHPSVRGVAKLVPGGAVADVVLLKAANGISAVSTTGMSAHIPNHACLPLADVLTAGAQPLANGAVAEAAFETAIDEWLLLTASALVGLATGGLALATEYAKERRAFGVVIGSYQGIAHPMADAATAIDGAQLLVREAAWIADRHRPLAGERAAMAFGFAVDTARRATYCGVHTLGGYGVMLEYDSQLFFRRARGWAGVFGDATAAYRRVAQYRYRMGANAGL